MPNSYKLHTANGSQSDFGFAEIDGWISSGFLKVYVNDVLQTTGYTLQDLNTASPFVRFSPTVPAANTIVRIQRETPSTVSGFQGNVVNFNDASVLTEEDLDNMAKGLLHIAQESEDTGSGALPLNTAQTHWTAGNKRLTNLADGIDAQDAITMAQFTTATLYGGGTTTPQVWGITGTGADTYTLSPAPLSTTEEMFLVEVGGVIQHPDTYTITSSSIVFDDPVGSGVAINVRNLGVARNINESVTTAMLVDDAVTTAKIAAGAVTATELASNAVETAKIAADAVTYAKIQNVSATDKILGRQTAGAGDVEEITCTAAGRALLDDATVAEQHTTLGLGGLAVLNTISNGQVATNAQIALSKLVTLSANKVVGCGAIAATPTELDCTSIGRSVLAADTQLDARTAIAALATPSITGSAVGRLVPISYTYPNPPTVTLQTVNANCNAGNWCVVILVHGTNGAYGSSHAAIMAFNDQMSTISGHTPTATAMLGGFAIRVS